MNIEQTYQQINDRTKRDYPQKGLHEVIALQASKTPDAVAVVSGDKTQTYRQLDQRSNCLLYTSPSPRDLSTSRMPSSA